MKKYFVVILILAALFVTVACNTSAGSDETSENATSAESAAQTTAVTEEEITTVEETAAEETTVAFTELSPANGETVSLVSARVYDWYTAYTVGSTLTVKTTVRNNFPVAATLKWEYAGDADKFTVRYGVRPDLSDGVAIETDKCECTLEDLFVATTYYWQVTADGEASPICSFITAETPRLLDVQKLQNARDLGGHATSFGTRMKQGIAYRTGRLDDLSEKEIDALNTRYGIRTELDLRYDDEVGERTESWLGSGVNYVHYASGQYLQLFTNAYPGALKSEIELFLDPENFPILFHCSVGKDRTGSLAALIQAVCGVSESDICRDYELSYLKNLQNPDLLNMTCEKIMYESFLPLLNQMKCTFGTDDLTVAAERMLQSLGFTTDDIKTLRRNLLGDGYTEREVEPWTEPEPARIPESADPVQSWSGETIADDLVGGSFRVGIKSVEVSGDKTYATLSADGPEGYVLLFIGTVKVRTAPVIAFRYRTSSFAGGSFIEVFTDSVNESETAGSSAKADLVNDGEWHTAVIDLESSIASFDGCGAKYFRIDLLNRSAAEDTVDYSFVGLFTSVDAANNYLATLP